MRLFLAVLLLVSAPALGQDAYIPMGDRPSHIPGMTFCEYCRSTLFLEDRAADRLTIDANFNCGFCDLDEREAAEQADRLRQREEVVDELFEIILEERPVE